MSVHPLRLCLVDMNNGVKNEAVRCFKRIFDTFSARVLAVNPHLPIEFRHVQPRNLNEQPSFDADLTLSSGGPGAPTDGFDDPWCTGYRSFLDGVQSRTINSPQTAPALMVVCHSFEISVLHFGVAEMARRETLRFGVFPSYTTTQGMESTIFNPFPDGRIFTWEHRRFEGIHPNHKRLAELGGRVLAMESRENGPDKGQGIMALDFGPGIVGTQFHPEADLPGVLAWVYRPEHADALREAYGEQLYERMMQTLMDPTRLARTYAMMIPTWLTHRFNQLAAVRGYNPVGPPQQDIALFEAGTTVPPPSRNPEQQA